MVHLSEASDSCKFFDLWMAFYSVVSYLLVINLICWVIL